MSGPALRGMAWDHPRAQDPLAAISSRWSKRSGIAASWDARPLKDFEDQPLEELATRYDLVLIDYPFSGTAAGSGLIVPAEEWVDAGYLADQAANSVGPSYRSYTWDGRQWALAVDAACQVSAVREDLWAAAGLGRYPDDWSELAELAAARAGGGSRVAVPLNPNHAYCAFLSVGVSLAGPDFWRPGGPVQSAAANEALRSLQALAQDLHPASRTDDPIGISDRMATSDEIVYVPLMFGYSSYARPGFRDQLLRFGNAPRGESGWRGSVLGGVGIALSARSAQRESAADLARLIASAEVQAGVYVDAGGQPGHAAAWESAAANEQTGGFFTATRETIEQAFVRPRVPGHRQFQPRAGALIHGCIWSGDPAPRACLDAYRELAETLLGDWQ